MEKLEKEATICTPAILLDPFQKIIKLEGESFPENVFAFYEDTLAWIEEYITTTKEKLTVHIKLYFFNTSSKKILTNILELFETYYDDGGEIVLNWYYNEEDEDDLDDAKVYVEDLPFEVMLIPYIED